MPPHPGKRAIAPRHPPPAFDEAAFIGTADGRPRSGRRGGKRFSGRYARQLAALATRLHEHDIAAAQRQAHRIYGAAASVSAEALREAALDVQAAARVGDLEAMNARFRELERQFLMAEEAMRTSITARRPGTGRDYENTDSGR